MKIKLLNIVRHFLVIGSALWASNTLAGYAGNLELTRIYGNSTIIFGTTVQPAGTCKYYGEYFTFDASTTAGKNILSMLLMAKASGKKVDLWYHNSSTPDTDRFTGCNSGTLAIITHVGVR